MSDLFVRVARELYDEREEISKRPVLVSMEEEDGSPDEIMMLFTRLPRLFRVDGPWGMSLVRAHDEQHALALTTDELVANYVDVEANEVQVSEITLQGDLGVIAEEFE